MSDDIVTRLRCRYNDPACLVCTFCVARAEILWLRAAGDALAVRHRKTFSLDGAFDTELRQWEEARRG